MTERTPTQSREKVLNTLAERIANIEKPHPVRTGIDGIETAGKTTLADALAPRIELLGRPVIRAGVDAFHAPRAVRYSKGNESAEGYYEDSFDYGKLNELLLQPLGPDGDRRYRTGYLDWATDAPIDAPEEVAPDNAILLFDGIFLLRPELRDNWDYHVFVDIDFDVAIQRALKRDINSFGSEDNIRNRYARRYHPAQVVYLDKHKPKEHADVVLNENDHANPKLIFSAPETELAKEVLQPNMKVQFVSRDLPVDGSGGTSAYKLSFLRYLESTGCEIEYILLDYKRADTTEPAEDIHRFDDIMTVKKIDVSNDEAPIWSDVPTQQEKEYVREQVQGSNPDLIIADHPWVAGVFDAVPDGPVKAVLTHDVQYQKIKDFKEAGVNPYKRNTGFEQPYWDEEMEKQHLSGADVIIAIQQDDHAVFKDMLPDKDVVTMPVAASIPESEQRDQVPGRCLFVGGGAGHNVRGLTWFLDNIWPEVIAKNPSANLSVSGDVCSKIDTERYAEQTEITFKGRVDSLDAEYKEAEVCVVPLEVGSGLKLKLIEAMSYGKAVVSTTVGVQGVEEVSQYGVSVTDNAATFAEEIDALLRDSEKRRRYEVDNEQFIGENFSPEAVYGNLISTVRAKAPRFQDRAK